MKIEDLECNGCVIAAHKVYMVVKNKILLHFYMFHVFYHTNYLSLILVRAIIFFRGIIFHINHDDD